MAIRNIVKHWNYDGNVVVVRPVFMYFSEILTGKGRRLFRPKKIVLDNISVIFYPIFKIPKIAYLYYPFYRYLKKHLKDIFFKPDIVVAHYAKSLQIGYQYARRNKLPLVTGFHFSPDLIEENSGNFNKRCGEIIEYSSMIGCRSLYIKKKIQKWYNRDKEKLFIAYSGIEENLIGNSTEFLKRLNQWKLSGNISFISASNLIERKKIHTNLVALAELKGKINFTYTIIGDGEERGMLEMLSIKLGISDQVFFKGKLSNEEVIEELRKSHIFIMVSCWETFGLVYLEAMATGNIVIGAKNEGIDGIINDRENGFLTPAGESKSLAILLKDIIFQMDLEELKNVLINSHRTISFYTEKQASSNYLKQLKKIKRV